MISKFSISFFLFISSLGFSQSLLPKDSTGKVVFDEVYLLDSTYTSFLLMKNAENWIGRMRNADKNLMEYEIEEKMPSSVSSVGRSTILKGKHDFLVYEYNGIDILNKVKGAVSCNLAITIKDGKYRFTASDFVYTYYKETREMMKLSPTSRKVAIEKTSDKGFVAGGQYWKWIKMQIIKQIETYQKSLKGYMNYNPDKIKQAQDNQKDLKKNW